ncbi:MAG: translesion error-prone DNA polymerase V autoproteolytic subunit [Bacteroidales bacterium]|nr:translesion error-prone DNA polymerase V autoproteolytic subunit [Bacteroidales bacterium]
MGRIENTALILEGGETMDGFIPHSLDEEAAFEGGLLGDVKAGFPSPAENIHEKLDLIRLLVRHRASTFFFRVDGVSMVDSGMDEGDIIIVDRSIDPYNNCKAVCYIDGEYTVKRVEIGNDSIRLMPANEHNAAYRPIDITPENNFLIWGVVTWVIKKM